MPAAQLATVWVMLPYVWRKPTCEPWGAGPLPEMKAELIPETPARLAKVQAEPVGS